MPATKNMPEIGKRAELTRALLALVNNIDELAEIVTYWRDGAVDSIDKADYRSIGRRLENALAQIDSALERAKK